MKTISTLALAVLIAAAASAAVPPAERLLPADTLGLITVPDWDKAAGTYKASSMSRFWMAPEMKPFREKFEERWNKEFIEPMERDLGFKVSELADFAHGQVTIAFLDKLIREENPKGGFLILADARDKSDAVTKRLAEVKKKWVDAGKELKTERVRDVEFSVYFWTPTNKPAAAGASRRGQPAGDDLRDQTDAKPKKQELCIGQAGSLLLLGESPKDFEKVLANLAGAGSSTLAEVPEFEANATSLFRDARAYGWLNVKVLYSVLIKKAAANSGGGANPFMPAPDKILEALGLAAIKTAAFHVNDTGDGLLGNFFIGAPESARKGLFKILVTERKDAGPPPFVPADAVKFSRWRADGKKLWATLEATLNEAMPQLVGALMMGLEAAGKDKDPNFDLKTALIGNLGDDIISYQKAPRSAKLEDLAAPPTVYLVGSPNPQQMVLALKTGVTLFGAPPDTITDREVLGRKIYRAKLPPQRNPSGRGLAERSFSFTQGGGYVAMSTDEATLEEFLRAVDSPGRSLRETLGLAAAAEKIGGLGTGWFGYENQAESIRAFFNAARLDPAFAEKLLTANPALALTGAGGVPGVAGNDKKLRELFDFSLLPPFEQVAKYFHFGVHTSVPQGDGLHFRSFLPTPPQLGR